MSDILERGEVFFLYWPAAGEERVEGLRDVQRFFLVLRPEGTDVTRRLVVGRKRLPDAEGDGRHWGFVDKVVRGEENVAEALERERLSGGAPRPAGEGRYAIVKRDGGTELVYSLALPEEPGEAQHGLGIGKEAGYVLSIKNPDAGSPGGAGLDRERRAELPRELRERFGDRRWAAADPPAFLDHEGTEFLLVAERGEAPSAEVAEELRAGADGAGGGSRLLEELAAAAGEPVEAPLTEGEWR